MLLLVDAQRIAEVLREPFTAVYGASPARFTIYSAAAAARVADRTEGHAGGGLEELLEEG